jgi:hypothetical protein
VGQAAEGRLLSHRGSLLCLAAFLGTAGGRAPWQAGCPHPPLSEHFSVFTAPFLSGLRKQGLFSLAKYRKKLNVLHTVLAFHKDTQWDTHQDSPTLRLSRTLRCRFHTHMTHGMEPQPC